MASAAEEYHEELTLRHLVDVKLSAHFSFPTLLPGAAPKDPSNLGTMTRVRSYNNVTSLLSSTRVVLL